MSSIFDTLSVDAIVRCESRRRHAVVSVGSAVTFTSASVLFLLVVYGRYSVIGSSFAVAVFACISGAALFLGSVAVFCVYSHLAKSQLLYICACCTYPVRECPIDP